jgi:hypothetical protein
MDSLRKIKEDYLFGVIGDKDMLKRLDAYTPGVKESNRELYRMWKFQKEHNNDK